ncbi:MAG: DNA repair protein RecO [Candidatus Levybacteria bacterium]|nr:DNA repair protein RecO [Candidatus Levybacteria bacterium]
MRNHKIEAIILKRRNLGDADKILTVLSKNNGKFQVKAPGVRKITSRRSPHVELLNFSELTLYSARISSNFLPTLTGAHTIEDFSNIKDDLGKIGYAYYICELTNGLCAEGQENKEAFSLLKSTLYELCRNFDSKKVVRYFERELLGSLGFWREVNLLKTYDGREVIERIIERKLKTTKVIPLFTS